MSVTLLWQTSEKKEMLYMVEANENLTIAINNTLLLIAAYDVLQVRQGGISMILKRNITFTGGEFH